MADYIEGKRPVIEALRTHAPINSILIADNLKQDGLVEDILRKSRQAGIAVKKVPRRELDTLSERGSHQGVMAKIGNFSYCNVNTIIEAATKVMQEKGAALIIILDHITDAGNLGAIARSAEVVGASGIIIPNKRSAHVTAATYKSSAGAITHIPICQVANIVQTIERLKKEGFWITGASEHAEESVWEADLSGMSVLVMGNEGEGLSRLVQENCDFLVKLPMLGKVNSLNVAQASTVLMYEWLRQNETKLL